MKRIFKLILLLSIFCGCNKNDEETIVYELLEISDVGITQIQKICLSIKELKT